DSVSSSPSLPSNRKAPVPQGRLFTAPAPFSSVFGETTDAENIPSSERKNGGGGLPASPNSNRTVEASTAARFLTKPNMSPQYEYGASSKWNGCFSSRWRSKLTATAAASHGVPSWNLTPGRSRNVIDFPSGARSHDVASAGSTSALPYWKRTSVS